MITSPRRVTDLQGNRALPPSLLQGPAYTGFVENQLSRCLISLSPLSAIHPRPLQRSLVRPSEFLYESFSLIADSSHRFGSLGREPSSSSLSPSLGSLQLLPFPRTRMPIIPEVRPRSSSSLDLSLDCPVHRLPSQYSLHRSRRIVLFVGGSTSFSRASPVSRYSCLPEGFPS